MDRIYSLLFTQYFPSFLPDTLDFDILKNIYCMPI